MTRDEDDFHIRPGKVRDRDGARTNARRIGGMRRRPASFLGEVHQAIRRAGGNPDRSGRTGKGGGRFNARGRGAAMGELEQQKAEIEKHLAGAPANMPDVHPNIAEHYRAKVIRLAETLAEPESNGEAREDIRSLIGEVVITLGEKRGESHATLRGELMAILDLAAGRRRSPRPEVITNALACPRNQPQCKTPALAAGGFRFGGTRQAASA